MPCLGDGRHGDMGPTLGGLSMALCLSLPDCSHKATLTSPSSCQFQHPQPAFGLLQGRWHHNDSHHGHAPESATLRRGSSHRVTWLGRAAGGHGHVAVFL